MSSDRLLSIIIPVYNVKDYLPRCLDSILGQELHDVEIILVDDGSKDGSEMICDDYARRFESVKVHHKDNEGVGIARNTGIGMAAGQWISFVDPDDFVEDDYFSSFLSLTSGEELVFFSIRILTKDGESKSLTMNDGHFVGEPAMQKGILPLMFNDQNCEFFVFTVNKFFKREIIVNNGIRFVPRLTFREDELFTLDYFTCINSYSTSSKSLYCYQIDVPGSLSHKKKSLSELLLFTDYALERFDAFSDFELKSKEYDRILHILINAYEDALSKEEFNSLYRHISSLVLTRSDYLVHLRKTRLLRIVFSLPRFLSIPFLRIILKRIHYANLKHNSESSEQRVLW